MREILVGFVLFWDGIIIWYFAALNLFYGLLFLLSVGETWRNWILATRLHLSSRFDEDSLPPISIIIPAFNEEATILSSLDSQLHLEYPHFEVIVVNDGSQDATFASMQSAYQLYEVPPAFVRRLETRPVLGYYRSRTHPNLLVIDKENGGKADALNAGINAARFPLCATVDADTIIAHDALPRIVRPFLMEDHVAGAGGTIRVANACHFERGVPTDPRVPKRFLAGVQVPEYLRAFLFGRLGWNRLGGNILVSGAFALFRRDLLIETGGYPVASVTEDLDLTVSLHRALRERNLDYTLPFVPDPVAWTEVPEDLGSLGRQRERWHRGLVRTLARNARLLLNPRYGRIGLISFPFFTFGEMLAPVVEVIGYVVVLLGIWLHLLAWEYAILFVALALGYMMLLSVWAVMLEELTYRVYPRTSDFFRLLLFALAEPFGYRQLTLYWRLKAFWKAVVRDRSWGRQKRKAAERRNRRVRARSAGSAMLWAFLAMGVVLAGRPAAAQTAADSAWDAGRREEARRLYRLRVEADSTDQRALLRLGLLEAWSGNYEQGLVLLDRVLRLNPGRLDATVARARVLAWSGRRQAAIDTLRGTLRHHPEDLEAVEALATVLSWEGRDREAIELLQEIVRRKPQEPLPRVELARALRRSGNDTAAREVLEEAARRWPEHPDLLVELGDFYLARGRPGLALPLYERLLASRPVEAHRGAARALARLGKLKRSERHWQRAIELEPQNPELHVGLAQVLRWQGRDAAAAAALRRARALEPGAGAEERSWLRRRTAPRIRAGVSLAEDSDGNELLTVTGGAFVRPVPRVELGVRAARGDHTLDAPDVRIERELTSGSLSLWTQFEPGWEARAELGRAFYATADGEDRTTFALGLASPRREPVSVSVSFDRDALGATAVLIRQRVRRNRLSADLRWRLARRVRLRADFAHANYRGSFSNRSEAGSLEATWEPAGGWELGFRGRAFGFRDDVADGYFDPEFYGKAAALFRYTAESSRFAFTLEAVPGLRRLKREGQPGNSAATVDATTRLTYRFAPGRELFVAGDYSRSGEQVFASGEKDYEYGAFRAGLLLRF